MESVAPHLVHIATPENTGTGFLFHRAPGECAFATAGHVIKRAALWGLPVRLSRPGVSDAVWMPRPDRCTLHYTNEMDSGLIIVTEPPPWEDK